MNSMYFDTQLPISLHLLFSTQKSMWVISGPILNGNLYKYLGGGLIHLGESRWLKPGRTYTIGRRNGEY